MSPDKSHQPRKRFGQNFLHDRGIIEQIIQTFDPNPALAIVEIGPGKGALTIPLLAKPACVHVIEIDTDLAELLTQKSKGVGELKLHIADALKFDFGIIKPAPLQIIGNLPYNISTPLLFHLLKDINRIKFMLLMLQKEVVDRICAGHNEPAYGRLSVMVQSQCQVEKLFNVPPGAFSPAPKVTSALIKIVPDPGISKSLLDKHLFEQLVRQAFSQRRKTIRNALKGMLGDNEFTLLSIAPTCRAENLSVDDYIRLANLLYKLKNQ